MPVPYSILCLDLHNTIYDETMEYGLAIEEGVNAWMEVAERCKKPLTRQLLYKELASGHRRIGSDWDGEVWRFLPSLALLGLSDAEFDKSLADAETRRRQKSRQLTMAGLYSGVHETLTALKRRGVRIYVITEASADVAMKAMTWLKLGNVVDGVYSYPSRKPPSAINGTYHKTFPSNAQGEHFKKPHPYLLAAVALDETIRKGDIPADIKINDLFTIAEDHTFLIPELSDNASAQMDARARLVLNDTPYAEPIRQTIGKMLYVGDSKFKDGLLALNTGIAFGYAAYGKKAKQEDEKNQRKNIEIMYAVTGWESDVLRLTQEAARSEIVDCLKADFTFENSLAEVLELFIPA